jgi:DNA helicase-2/ATP-dependent DNA helicase PcrA
MTRAMRELYLSHARLREFRGQMNYTIGSMFLEELPTDVEHEDLSARRNYARSAADEWRAKANPAVLGWAETGASHKPIERRKPADLTPTIPDPPDTDYAAGQVVQHDEYGIGQITEVIGFGVLRRVKIRFPGYGEKVFVADKMKVKVLKRKG